jgi:membrane protein DedA with SNARE-associated domain
LPVSIAMTKTYFIINNLISLIVAALIMSLSVYIMNDELQLQSDFFQVVVMVLSIIFVANLVDYMRYRKSQIHLLQYKKSMRQK